MPGEGVRSQACLQPVLLEGVVLQHAVLLAETDRLDAFTWRIVFVFLRIRTRDRGWAPPSPP